MSAPVVKPRETRAPVFPAVVHTYTDLLRVLDQTKAPMSAAQLAEATDRVVSNVRRDLPKLREAGVIAIRGDAIEITPKGERWVDGQDVAEGRGRPTVEAGALAEPLARRAAHAAFRPNPEQPRKAFDEAVIRGIAETIVADAQAGGAGVLQPLLVRPRDPADPLDGDEANPVRMIWAGEQRWRAIGLLIAEGRLPDILDPARGGGIPFEERAEPPGGAAFLALVENGARSDLDPLEEAFAFLDYVTREGLSARQAAINTGRAAKGEGGVRTVQIRLKVAREATPEAIARYRRDRDWNALVDSVQQKGETPEDLRARAIRKGVAGLMGRRRLALIELAHKAVLEPDDSGTGRQAVKRSGFKDPTGAMEALIQHAGAIVTDRAARISDVARTWLIEEGLLDPENPRRTLAAAWREHGLLETTIDDRLTAEPIVFSTEWLNLPPPAQPAPDEDEPTMFDPPPAPATRSLAQILPGRSVITLAEILHLAPAPDEGAFIPQAQAGKYWLDANVSTMKDAGLLTLIHEPGQPPFVRITDTGLQAFGAALAERGQAYTSFPLSRGNLDRIRGAWGQAGWPQDVYGMVTEWLNIEPAQDDPQAALLPSAAAALEEEPEDDRTVDDILGPLALMNIVEAADPANGPAFLSGLFERVGFRGPFVASQAREEEGVVHDATGRLLLTCDQHGEETHDMALAQAIVVAAALNASLGLSVDVSSAAREAA
jgi:ParB-like chromosome segregation protein Spo0J